MPSGVMRIFGRSTKTQLAVLGIVLAALGAAGAFGVMLLPNEDPASLIGNPAKADYYGGVSVWAIFGFLMVTVAGILVLGIAFTGLPFVHMAKYHMGVFYVSIFSLVLIPSAFALNRGLTLMADAKTDTLFAADLTGTTFTSPAGLVATGLAAALVGICLFIIAVNLLPLAAVSFRPSLVRGAAIAGIVLVVVVITTYSIIPGLVALDFDYGTGKVGAVGFEEFEPQDIHMTPGWLKWLSSGEYRSTYGTMSFRLSLLSLLVFISIVISVLGFIGLALYSANERKPQAYNLTMAPIAVIALAVLALLFYFTYSGAVGDMAERLNVATENTKITYAGGDMTVALAMLCIIMGVGVFYTITLKDWLASMSKSKKLRDPISMSSLVDPPSGLPPPPTGWPARWNRMSTNNYIVVTVAVILVFGGLIGGVRVKGAEGGSSEFNPTKDTETVVLDELPDMQRTFDYSDYAAEGATRTFLWQADGVWFIKGMTLQISWTDEEPMPRHENQPDTFEGAVNSTTGESVSQTGASIASTRTGQLTTYIEFEKYILTTDVTGLELPEGAVSGSVTVNITCVEALDSEPIGVGILVFPDDGNDFTAQLIVDYKLYEKK